MAWRAFFRDSPPGARNGNGYEQTCFCVVSNKANACPPKTKARAQSVAWLDRQSFGSCLSCLLGLFCLPTGPTSPPVPKNGAGGSKQERARILLCPTPHAPLHPPCARCSLPTRTNTTSTRQCRHLGGCAGSGAGQSVVIGRPTEERGSNSSHQQSTSSRRRVALPLPLACRSCLTANPNALHPTHRPRQFFLILIFPRTPNPHRPAARASLPAPPSPPSPLPPPPPPPPPFPRPALPPSPTTTTHKTCHNGALHHRWCYGDRSSA